MESTNAAVIGAGLAGAATARSLARRGVEVALLERTTPANAQGSSHGSARIFRYAYPDPFYVDLVARSKPLWDELSAEAGTPLVTPTGCVDHGELREPEVIARALAQVGVEHEYLTAAQASARFGQIEFTSDAIFHPGAGVIDAERTVNALVASAQAAGARVEQNWEVAGVEAVDGGYELTSASGATLRARELVVAAGGWLPWLLERLPLPASFAAAVPTLTVRQENAFHFPYRDDVADAASWPTVIHKSAAMQSYSLPGGRDAGFRGQKLAEFNGGAALPSALDQNGVVDAANRARVSDYVSRTLPGLEPTPYAETTCLFTSTPNEHFIIDGVNGITILSPCSGHGGKFAPLLGELAADRVTGGPATPEPFLLRAGASAGAGAGASA